MPDEPSGIIDFLKASSFAITIGFIGVSIVLGAFFRGRAKDKCLKDFAGYPVTLKRPGGKTVYGNLRVETTGMEFNYPASHVDERGHAEMSFIFYKHEYPKILALVRYHDQLDERQKEKREKDLARTYHPSAVKRLGRKLRSFFNTVRDSVMEVVGLLVGRARATATGGALLGSRDKHVSQMQKGFLDSISTSFEPLFERHIGKKVVVDVVREDGDVEYAGVLKEHTTDFIEMMDVDYDPGGAGPSRKADLLLPRRYGVVRHLGE